MAEIVKIDDVHVARVGTQEVRQIFTSTDLASKKIQLEERLAEINELIEALK